MASEVSEVLVSPSESEFPATEKLRAMLDELGIKWETPEERWNADSITYWKVGDIKWAAFESENDTLWLNCSSITDLIPEQAIAATVGAEKLDTSELCPDWEQVLYSLMSGAVAQDNLNECVHELLEKSATVGRSCSSCPEMDNPDSYIAHLQSALKWHDEHVPRPTNPLASCVVLQGNKPPEEVMFVREGGGVTHYLPDNATVGAGTCQNVGEGTFVCSKCGAHVHMTNVGRSYVDENGKRWYSTSSEHKFRHCPNCGKRIEVDE